jgi:hypothetical protein
MTTEIDVNPPHGQVHQMCTNMQNMKAVKLLTPHRIAPERLIIRRYDWLQSFPSLSRLQKILNLTIREIIIRPMLPLPRR